MYFFTFIRATVSVYLSPSHLRPLSEIFSTNLLLCLQSSFKSVSPFPLRQTWLHWILLIYLKKHLIALIKRQSLQSETVFKFSLFLKAVLPVQILMSFLAKQSFDMAISLLSQLFNTLVIKWLSLYASSLRSKKVCGQLCCLQKFTVKQFSFK